MTLVVLVVAVGRGWLAGPVAGMPASPSNTLQAVVRPAAWLAYADGLSVDHARVILTSTLNEPNPIGDMMALTQTQVVAAVADRAEMSKADARRALAALEEVVLEELGNAQKVRLAGVVQLTVRVKPATKARKGRNPATGEEITIAAKKASVDVRARPLAKAKSALPSVQKARRRLAA